MSRTYDSLNHSELSLTAAIAGAGASVATTVKETERRSATPLLGHPIRESNAAPASHEPSMELSPQRPERRKQKRAAIKMGVRIRPAETKDGNFVDVLETVNVCRGGLYFCTASGRFYQGMRLRVTFPYNSKHDNAAATEENGAVERLESLPGNRVGVAIQLRGAVRPMRLAVGVPHHLPGAPRKERRLAGRTPFSGTATLIEGNSQTRLQARCSDVSANGCYVDTLNPFPEGTIVKLGLSYEEDVFKTVARVISSHAGMGMGLVFAETPSEQAEVLNGWLNKDLKKDKVESRPIAKEPAPLTQTQAELSDRQLLITLIRVLRSKGILTEADEPALPSEHLS